MSFDFNRYLVVNECVTALILRISLSTAFVMLNFGCRRFDTWI